MNLVSLTATEVKFIGIFAGDHP